MDKTIKVWFDAEADFLEVLFGDAPGLMVETDDESVMKRVGHDGTLLGFAIMGVSRHARDKHPLRATIDMHTAA